MESVPHLPALRRGTPYESLETVEVKNHRNGEVKARVSQVNAGIIRKDLQRISASRDALKRLTTEQLLKICARAGELFREGTLSLGEQQQSPARYIEALAATSGLPHVLIRRNMGRIYDALTRMPAILENVRATMIGRPSSTRGTEVAYSA